MSSQFRAESGVLAALDYEVREGIRILPRRGLEIGGLLIGEAADAVAVTGVRKVEVEHRFGPSFVLSETDVETFRNAISEASAGGEVIGHFRSQTKGAPEIRDADERIANLIDVPRPLLLIVPVSNGNPEPVRLYRRENGAWMEAGQSPAPVQPAEIAVRPTPLVRRATSTWTGPKWRLALVAIALSAGALVSHYALRRPPAPLAPSARPGLAVERGIGLAVERGNGAVVVHWDAASLAIQQAVSGVLIIQDGGPPREVSLSREQLLASKVIYPLRSAVAEFRLQVYRDREHYVAEGVKIETGVVPEKLMAAFELEEAPAAVVKADREVEAPVAMSSPSDVPKAQRRMLTVPVEPPPLAGSMVDRAIAPPEVAHVPAAMKPLPDIIGRVPALEPPAVSYAVEPPAVSYVAAVPLRRVNASVPPHLRSAIRDSTAVEVKVSIDASGKVINAVPVNTSDFAAQVLAPQATQAARLWSFSPARLNGQPQSSELVVTFTFDRGPER